MVVDILIFCAYLLPTIVLFNRYIFGPWLASNFSKSYSSVPDSYEPTITIAIPCFNEGESIKDTILSLVALDYPKDKLKIVVVDDCSTDDSYSWAKASQVGNPNVEIIRNLVNMGKRKSLNKAILAADSELIVSVDSDVLVNPDVLRKLVKGFDDPNVAAVGGRVCVLNANENWLTRMQAIKYYFGYVYLKKLEVSQRQVMCLSGCLTAYRRKVLLEVEPIVENRNLLGVPIKYGEDRFLTRQIVKAGYDTTLNFDAVCYTKAPPKLKGFFQQQLRWRRSNFVDFLGGITHPRKLKPLVALHYYSLMGAQFLYPVLVSHLLISMNYMFAVSVHLGVLAVLSIIYYFETRDLSDRYRVDPVWFLPMAVVIPVTYLLLSTLAIFTLDSGSWETRGQPAVNREEDLGQIGNLEQVTVLDLQGDMSPVSIERLNVDEGLIPENELTLENEPIEETGMA